MGMIQRVAAAVKGEIEEIKIRTDNRSTVVKVPPFTERQEQVFYEFARFIETYEFRSSFENKSIQKRAGNVAEQYSEWANKVTHFLKEVAGINNYMVAIETLYALYLSRREIFTKYDIVKKKEMYINQQKAQLNIRHNQLEKEKDENLHEIEKSEAIIVAAEDELAQWQPIQCEIEPIPINGRLYTVPLFGEQQQWKFEKLVAGYPRDEECIEFIKEIVMPVPKNEEISKLLYQYFEENNEDLFSEIFMNNRRKTGVANRINSHTHLISKLKERNAEIEGELEMIEQQLKSYTK